MDLVQADFVGNARVYSDESSNREFERIFGFPPQLIRDAVRMALRSYMESDDIHTQLSGPGSNLYHTLVEQCALRWMRMMLGRQTVPLTITPRLALIVVMDLVLPLLREPIPREIFVRNSI